MKIAVSYALSLLGFLSLLAPPAPPILTRVSRGSM